jgi:hypothetical protein
MAAAAILRAALTLSPGMPPGGNQHEPSLDRHGARLACPPNPAEEAHVAT